MHADSLLLPDDSVRAVESLCEAFDARSIRYALIGGLASVLRGQPRFTQDADFLLDVPQVVLPGLLDDLVQRGFAPDPAIVAKQCVRESMTSFPFGRVRIHGSSRSSSYSRTLADAAPLEGTVGQMVRVATAEGLILTKMVAFRPQDRVDIETLLTANRDTIDVPIIREEWSPYAATEEARTAWLEAAIARRVVRRE